MKIRTSITNYYDSIFNDAAQYFCYSPQLDKWVGNPSKDRKVSQYMRSLKRRKALVGETAKSARAITCEDMKALYSRCITINNNNSARQYVCIFFNNNRKS